MPEDILRSIYMNRAGLSEDEIDGESSTEILWKGESFECSLLLDGQQRLSSLDLMFSRAYHQIHKRKIGNDRYRWFLDLSKLGLLELEWPNLRSWAHQDARDAIVGLRYIKSDTSRTPFHWDIERKNEDKLIQFCNPDDSGRENLQADIGGRDLGLLLPLDRVVEESEKKGTLLYNSTFVYRLFRRHKDWILSHSAPGKEILEEKGDLDPESAAYVELDERLDRWRTRLGELIGKVFDYGIPVEQVSAEEFPRVAGIFSVINLEGVKLDTFDLLVAKTAEKNNDLRREMQRAIENLNMFASREELEEGGLGEAVALLPTPSRDKANKEQKANIADFWTPAEFLREKRTKKKAVNFGEEFPDRVSSSYAQTIALFVGLTYAWGDGWWDRNDPLSRCRENAKNPELVAVNDPIEAVRSVYRLPSEKWSTSDRRIVGLRKDHVQNVQRQAAVQLLRALFLTKARFGARTISDVQYKLHLVALACVLTDRIWGALQTRPVGLVAQKIDAWYWGSIFGGAYQSNQETVLRKDVPRLVAYLNNDKLRWSDMYDMDDGGKQLRWSGEPVDRSKWLDVRVQKADGTMGYRFESIFEVAGYSDKQTLMSGAGKRLANSVRSYVIRKGVPDFADGDKQMIDVGYESLEADHLFSRDQWKKKTGEEVDRSNEEHILNSALNYTFISRRANRHWSGDPLFAKIGLTSAVEGDREQQQVLRRHFLPIDAVDRFKNEITSDDSFSEKDAKEILSHLLERRFDELQDDLYETVVKPAERM